MPLAKQNLKCFFLPISHYVECSKEHKKKKRKETVYVNNAKLERAFFNNL